MQIRDFYEQGEWTDSSLNASLFRRFLNITRAELSCNLRTLAYYADNARRNSEESVF